MQTTKGTNLLDFYQKAKEFFAELDFSNIPDLQNILDLALPAIKVLIIHNNTNELTVYDDQHQHQLVISDLIDALPLLFQSYSYEKLNTESIAIIDQKAFKASTKHIDGACFALDINNESLWFVFLNPVNPMTPEEEKLIKDIAFFLEDLMSFAINVTQGEELAEKLRNEKKKQSVWLESLAWLNELGNQEYTNDELNELYKSALFQLKLIVRADNAIAYLVEEDSSLSLLVNHGENDLSTFFDSLLVGDFVDSLASHKNMCLLAKENETLKKANINSICFYPLFLQKKLKLILGVCKSSAIFDDNENMIATLFSEGLEHIIERMYFLRAMRQQNAFLKKEKLEQQNLITKLREAQEQILQNEKMASIGQLAAGVAHEINNPVGYVNSNINSLDGYITDIYDVLDLYQQMEEGLPSDNVQRKQIKELKADIDFEFIRDDIKELVSESKEGVLRVKQIVKDLKDFSHVDEAEWSLTDIEKGIDSTLNIVHNELKYKAKVIKDYGNIPKIECVPSQINQILMNLMVNAGHAIEEQGTITLITRQQDDDTIYVEVVDTGKGIPEANLTKIFDPFFTTKPVGQGTGLGLSLSYSIAEKHRGELSVRSKVGEGTTFRLTLPIKKKEGTEEANAS